jgi:putative transposase
VKANQAELPAQTMCRVLRVSTSGYYAWRDRAPSRRALANAALSERIGQIHAGSDATYGMPRVRAELAAQGERTSRKRVARLMRAAGLRGVSRRRGFIVTTQRDKAQRAAPDLVQRAFVADGPNRLWVADMTYVPTWAGFIYLAVVLDVWSRRVVGWAIGESMVAELVIAALNMATSRRKARGVVHHSDHGSQYTSLAFGKRCQEMGVTPSMGSVGDAYDNAMAESFFATLECELINRRSWKTKPKRARRCSRTSKVGTTRAGATARSATSRRWTSRPSTARPNPSRGLRPGITRSGEPPPPNPLSQQRLQDNPQHRSRPLENPVPNRPQKRVKSTVIPS